MAEIKKEERGLQLNDRKELEVKGVKEVLSFDENGAELLTENGELTVEGASIRISELDTDRGRVRITGRIDMLCYSAEPSEKKKGLRARIFGG
jgi:sporulation protein YabP